MRYVNYDVINKNIAGMLEQYLLQRVLKDSLKKDPYHTPQDQGMVDWKVSANLTAYRDTAIMTLDMLGYSGDVFIVKRPTNKYFRGMLHGYVYDGQPAKLSIDTCLWILSTVGSAPLHAGLNPAYISRTVAAVSYVYHVMKR